MNMRILLNLLPQEKQAQLSTRFYSRFFLWQSCLVLLLVLFYMAILGGMYVLLSYEAKNAESALASYSQYDQETKRLLDYQATFKQANTLSQDLQRYLTEHHQWGKLFMLLESLTPEGVALVELITKEYTVSLIGRADTRDQFLAFEAALKEAGCTSDVKVPLSNLFTQTELDFQLDFNVKRECLLSQ